MTAAKALPTDLIGENGLLKQITKALVERASEAEMESPKAIWKTYMARKYRLA